MRLRFFSAAVVAAIAADASAVTLQSETEDNRQLEYGRILTLAQDVHNMAQEDSSSSKSKTAIYEPAKM